VTLVLVRHGETDALGRVLSGRSATPMNAAGKRAARAAAAAVAALGAVTEVWASPRRRAKETGELIAAACAAPLQIAPALDETDFGAWTGKSFAELAADPDWRAYNAARAHAAPPGGESFRAVLARVGGWLDRLPQTASARVLAAHDDSLKAALVHTLGWPPGAMTQIALAPAGVTVLRRTGADWTLAALNLPGGAP
jgi:broad specificity phosphatase PhoE